MSEIRATTISDAAGTGPINLHKQSAAKAWGNFNDTGSPAVRDSMNVSSFTDIGTGRFNVNFTNAFTNTTYVSQGSASTSSSNTNGIWTNGSGGATASSRTVVTQNTNGSSLDVQFAQGSFMGDLA